MNNPPARGTRTGCKRPKDSWKGRCWESMVAQGWAPERRGFPTYMAWCGDTVAFVEANYRRSAPQRRNLKKLFGYLTRHGIQCYWWSPQTGFVLFKNDD